MKTKLFLLGIMILALSSGSIAQPAAGKGFVGGSFSISASNNKQKSGSTTTENWKSTNFSIGPRAGFFLSDNLAVGAGVGFSRSSTTYPNYLMNNDRVVRSSNFSLSPFARYYFGIDNVGFFAEANSSLGYGRSKVTLGNTTTEGPKTSSFSMGIAPGFYFYVNENLSLDTRFGFLGFSRSQSKNNDDNKNITNGFSMDFSPNALYFGLLFHF
jgi:hypothetical protein